MTVKKRLQHSNTAMLIIPVSVAGLMLFIGIGLAFALLKYVYLPQLGISLHKLHQTSEQIEDLVKGSSAVIGIYAVTVAVSLLLTIVLTNIYLTHKLFKHISGPLDILTAGVDRIMKGDLDTPIAYSECDEFKAACDAVDEMAARLKASLEEQQTEQQKKQELIAGMSHDLKSPLTSIRAYTEALMEGVARDENTRCRYLQTIYAKESDIEAMVNRLFAFAKTNMNEYPADIQSINLFENVQSISNEWKSDKMIIHIDIPSEINVLADKELLKRILSNLFGNSMKYSGHNCVNIDITADTEENAAVICFMDDGAGVPEEQLPKIFDAFYRTDAARTAPGDGSGLGLAVVKKSVEQMHGSIYAENAEDGGLAIIFTLPAAKEDGDG